MPTNLTPGALLFRGVIVLLLLFVLSPLLVIIIASFGEAAFLQFPPKGFSLKWYAEIPRLNGLADALSISLQLAGSVTPIVVVLGVAASLALARYQMFGGRMVMAFLLSPLVVPAVVIGIAMLQFFHTVNLVSTFGALMTAHVAITLPYMVRTVTASLEMEDVALLEAAKVLGATGLQTFFYVTLPIIKPSVFTGAVFVFITSFDNYAISLFMSDASTMTLPIKMLEYIETRIDPTVAALSSLLIVFAVLVLVVSTWLVGLRRIAGIGGK